MQYPSGVDKLRVGIEEINPVMPPRGNAWVVEEGQGVDSVQEILHSVMGKECQTNITTIRWNGISNEIHRTWMRPSPIISNSTYFTHTINELKIVHICGHTGQKLANIENRLNTA